MATYRRRAGERPVPPGDQETKFRRSGGRTGRPGKEEEVRGGYDEEAVGGGEPLLGGEGEREVPDAERVRGVVGGVAPAHLPLHQLLGAPHRRWIRRHFSVHGVQEAAGCVAVLL